MDMQELIEIGKRLRQVLCEYVPEQSVESKAGFCMDSDIVTLSFHITVPGGYRAAKAEMRREQVH